MPKDARSKIAGALLQSPATEFGTWRMISKPATKRDPTGVWLSSILGSNAAAFATLCAGVLLSP